MSLTMDHNKALEDKMHRYANFHISQIRKEETEYDDSDEELTPRIEVTTNDDSPIIERTLSNSSRFSKEQLILDANRVLKCESFDRSTGTNTPTNKKKSVVIIAPRTSSFSVSSRTSSQHQMSSSSASPIIMPDVKGVALVPPVDSPLSFKTEYADVAWQNLNEKLDMLLKTDNYRTLSSSDLHNHSSSSSDIPRSPKRPSEDSPLLHHSSSSSLVNGERHSGEGRPENGSNQASSGRSAIGHVTSSPPTSRSTTNGHSNGSNSNDLSRALEQEPYSSNGSPGINNNKSMAMKKKSSRSLMKRLSSHNVMVDNTLYIDDDSADEEEEVYGVAMNTSKQQQEIELDRMLQVQEKQNQIKARSMSACSSDEDDVKPVKVRDLRRAASYVYDQREGSSGSGVAASGGSTGNHNHNGSLSVIVEMSPPPSNSTLGSVEASPREETPSEKQRREQEQQRAMKEIQANDQQLKELVYQQQLQIQQLQLQQQRYLEQQQHMMSQHSPSIEPKSLKSTQSIEQMALAYIKEAQNLANAHVMSPAVSAVVNVTESWRSPAVNQQQHAPQQHQQQLPTPPQYFNSFPTSYPPQHPYSNNVSPQKTPRDQGGLQSASLDELLAMGLSPAEAHAIYAEHVQVKSAGHSQSNSQSNSRSNSRASSPATLNKNSNVDMFTDNPLVMASSHSSLSSLNRADFIERTISAELDVTSIYDDSHPKPPTVPHLKYVPSRQAMAGGPPQMDSPQLSQRSGSNQNMGREDYPPTGKLKKSNSQNRYVPDDVSVTSHVSNRSNNSQTERIAVGPSAGAGRDRSPAQNHLLSPQQLQLMQQQQLPMMMPPLHMSSPPHPQYKQHQSLDHMTVSMDQRAYNRSYSDPMSINNSMGGKNPPLLRNNVEHLQQQQQHQAGVRLRPARMDSNNTSLSSLSGDNQEPYMNTSPRQQHQPYYPSHYPPASVAAGNAGGPVSSVPFRALSRQNSNVSAHSHNSGGNAFPYPRDIISHPYHMLHIQRQARSPIPFGNYLSILEDNRQPDDVALDLGLTLSKQESIYGCNMFDWFDPAQDEEEVLYLMELGYARNIAIEMIFDRSRRRA